MLHFDIFTLFPQMFTGAFSESILKRAQENQLLSVALHNIRDYTTDRHHVCDDTPYGGGGGMIMKPEPIMRAVETVLQQPAGWMLAQEESHVNLSSGNLPSPLPNPPLLREGVDDGETISPLNRGRLEGGVLGGGNEPVSSNHLPAWDDTTAAPLPDNIPIILLSPQGRLLTQPVAVELSRYERIVLICGRYEGIDERVRSQLVTDELSIGDYVLSGGELAAMVVVDAVTRLLPGALGYELGATQDSHSSGLGGLLEGPQYTRPALFRGEGIPPVLTSGHHANMQKWARQQSLLRTLQNRPELLFDTVLSEQDKKFLAEQGWMG